MQGTIKKISVCCGFCLGLFSMLCAQSGVLDNIKDQNITPTESFETINIADFILPGVSCGTVELTAIRTLGTDTKPTTACEKTEAYHSTMNALVQISYGRDGLFNHEADYLMLYNDKGEIVECGNPSKLSIEDILLKEAVYNLNINGGSAKYPVRMVFYSGADQQLYERDSIFEFLQNTKMGKIGTPYQLDLAPIVLAASLTDDWMFTPVVQDADFVGQLCYQIKVTDCDNGQSGMDEVCFGVGIDAACQEAYTLSAEMFASLAYNAAKTINAANVIHATADVTYQAGESITLKSGFEVKAGASFLAKIATCIPLGNLDDFSASTSSQQVDTTKTLDNWTQSALFGIANNLTLKIVPNPVSTQATFHYYLPETERVQFSIIDVKGRRIEQVNGLEKGKGWHHQTFDVSHIPSGIYFVTLGTAQHAVHQKMLIR